MNGPDDGSDEWVRQRPLRRRGDLRHRVAAAMLDLESATRENARAGVSQGDAAGLSLAVPGIPMVYIRRELFGAAV